MSRVPLHHSPIKPHLALGWKYRWRLTSFGRVGGLLRRNACTAVGRGQQRGSQLGEQSGVTVAPLHRQDHLGRGLWALACVQSGVADGIRKLPMRFPEFAAFVDTGGERNPRVADGASSDGRSGKSVESQPRRKPSLRTK
jgi:hypothetical protein